MIKQYFQLFALLLITIAFPGSIRMKAAIPEANWLYLHSKEYDFSRIGFLGISGGVEKHLTRQSYLSFDADGIMTYKYPVPVSAEKRSKRLYSTILSVQWFAGFDRISAGAGPQITYMYYFFEEFDTHDNIVYDPACMGLRMSFDSRVTKHFFATLNYCPTFYNISDKSVRYAHSLFLALCFKTGMI